MRPRILIATILATVLSAVALAPAAALGADNDVAVCAKHVPGQAHCDADLLAHGGRLVHPRVSAVPAAARKPRLAWPLGQSAPQPATPQYLQQAYDLTALSASRGAGDTIAIVDAYDDPYAASDLSVFRRTYGLPACGQDSGCLRIVNQRGQAAPLPDADPSWAVEENLDLQAVSAICPNCRLILVEANSGGQGDLGTAMQAAVNLGANQISDSWSITASPLLPPYSASFLKPAPGAALPSVVAASGDAGVDPLGTAEYPAALPDVTAVGGTTLTRDARPANPRGFSESAWSSSGSGCAVGVAASFQPATGCAGRAYSDISADADPNTGLSVYQAADGGWTLAGGTSLATPMVAAFEALTGQGGSSPAWAYADAAALNVPSGGSNGNCSGLAAILCDAGLGYHGPTGSGSLSGDVVTGAPGVAASPYVESDLSALYATAATLQSGIYTNGLPTTYYWQYGSSTAYGKQSHSAVLGGGQGAQTISTSLSGLAPASTYHYRLVATNAAGTSYGPDYTLKTLKAAKAKPKRKPAKKKPVKRKSAKKKPAKRRTAKPSAKSKGRK